MHSHRFDPLSLVAGVLFGVVGIIAIVGSLTWADLRGEWVGPVLLGAAGIALLATVPFRGSPGTEPTEPELDADLGSSEGSAAEDADQPVE